MYTTYSASNLYQTPLVPPPIGNVPYTSPPGGNIGFSSAPSQPSSRFVPQNFKYNGKVALALLPSLAVVASYGGSEVLAALVVRFQVV